MKVIRISSLADGRATFHDGRYLQYARFDGLVAELLTTKDINDALVFPTVIQALDYWRRQSEERPLRPDGKPNRPFTAYTIEVVDAAA